MDGLTPTGDNQPIGRMPQIVTLATTTIMVHVLLMLSTREEFYNALSLVT